MVPRNDCHLVLFSLIRHWCNHIRIIWFGDITLSTVGRFRPQMIFWKSIDQNVILTCNILLNRSVTRGGHWTGGRSELRSHHARLLAHSWWYAGHWRRDFGGHGQRGNIHTDGRKILRSQSIRSRYSGVCGKNQNKRSTGRPGQ